MKFFNSQNFPGITGPVIINFSRVTDQASALGEFYRKSGSTWKKFPLEKAKFLEKATSIKINYAYLGAIHEGNYTMVKEPYPNYIWKYTFTLNKVSVNGYSLWDYAGAVFTKSIVQEAGITPVHSITFTYDGISRTISDFQLFTFEDLRYQNNGEYGGMLELGSGTGIQVYMNKFEGKSKSNPSSVDSSTMRDDMALEVPKYTSFFGRYTDTQFAPGITEYNHGSSVILYYSPAAAPNIRGWVAYFILTTGNDAFDPNADPEGSAGTVVQVVLGTSGSGWNSRSMNPSRSDYPEQTDNI